MADAILIYRLGEKRPLFGQESADSDLTISDSPAPTITLYDADGEVVEGFDSIDVTGYDQSAATTVRAWYVLDSAALEPGWYTAAITMRVTAADSIIRTVIPTMGIQVRDLLD
jgi:hypothetical protein